MTEIIACCGLACHTCPIFLATLEKNKEERLKMRVEIVRICKEQYGMNYELADITDCDGCRTEGLRLFSACLHCHIRICAREKKLESCAYCAEYACEKLEAFFRTDSSARTRLNAIKGNII